MTAPKLAQPTVLTLPPEVAAALGSPGPCGICGAGDARHRVLDAITECCRAGDTPADVAADYAMPLAVVAEIVKHWNTRQQRWQA
jgi:hypothetical protein